MIKKLEWDSNLFGYTVGQVNAKSRDDFDIAKFIENSKKFKLVYVISDFEISTKLNFKLVDKKVLFSKPIEFKEKSTKIVEYNSKKHSYKQLLALAYLSGSLSRFSLDSKFKNDEFKKLYKQWIDKSINKEVASKIFIRHINNRIAGFVTLKIKDSKTTQIGLIAVSELFQGQNIATNLINECEYISLKNQYSNIEVITQLDNIPAIKLYKRKKFKIKSIKYIYHFWNL
jgi:dTDP-4-amino-4,6-dideoxy-D-galactose acyltransferase